MTSIQIAVTPTQVEAARAIVRRDRAKGVETDRAILTIAEATEAGIARADIESYRSSVELLRNSTE